MRRALVCSLPTLLAACSDDDTFLKLKLVSYAPLLYIDVSTEDELGQLADQTWFDVAANCSADASGRTELGSLVVRRDSGAAVRVRVRGYRAADGLAQEVISQRVTVSSSDGDAQLELALAASCLNAMSCPMTATCNPADGRCGPIPAATTSRLTADRAGPYCLQKRREAPPLASPAMTIPMPDAAAPEASVDATVPERCVSGDNQCPPGCRGTRDLDCLLELGSACGPTTEDCAGGLTCRHGFCCNVPCGGPCERCDLPNQPGRCSPLLFSAIEAPLSSPDATFDCREQHVEVTCAKGKCSHACMDGYGNCDDRLQDTGCETPLGSELNCASCGDVCQYGFCGSSGCEQHITTTLASDSCWPARANTLYAVALERVSEDTVVRALGILVEPHYPTRGLRLGIYEVDNLGVPVDLLVQTEALPVEDELHSAVPSREGAVRVEGKVPRVALDRNREYVVAVLASDITQLCGAAGSSLGWFVSPTPFGEELPDRFPLEEQFAEQLVAWSLYVVTTPQ